MKLGKAWFIASAIVALAAAAPSQAAHYWTLYNQEGTSADISTIATFATFEDMVSNRNAQQAYLGNGDAGDPLFTDVHNRVATGYDGTRYWSLYNQEGTSADISTIATFATFEDMVSNRNAKQAYLGNGDAGDPLFTDVHNRVATGYDGIRYWSLYNQEGTSGDISTIATFATFEDMVSNRNAQQAYLGNGDAGDPLFTDVHNRVATGYDGTRYWSLYNQEGTSADNPTIAIFATFEDMESNRNAQQAYLGNPDAGDPLFTNVHNRIAAGSDFFPSAVPGVPEPATWMTMILGFGAVGGAQRRRRRLAYA